MSKWLPALMSLCSAAFPRRVVAARARNEPPEATAASLSREASPYACATAADHPREPVLRLAGGSDRFTAVVEGLRDADAFLNRGGRRNLQPLHAAIAARLRSAERLVATRADHRLVYHHSRGSKP